MGLIALPRIMRVGSGALEEAGALLRSLNLRKPLIVTDAFLVKAGVAERLVAILGRSEIRARVFAGVVPDPTIASVRAALAALSAGDHDCVIGLGGGSPIDTAKAVAVLAVVGGEMSALKSPHQQDEPGLPIIAVPTTAGTGSEATRFTIITDERVDEKMLCVGLAYLPTAAIVDFELSLTMPKRLTADTGVDALTHAIEAYVSRQANPFADDVSLIAMRALWENLRLVYADPNDRGAREAMMLAATQAGIAFSNSSVALVHGMSRPIGAFFHLAHGLSNAMLLPAVTKFSVEAGLERYADCARQLGLARSATSDAAAGEALVDGLYSLNRDLEVPSPRTLGIAEARWNEVKPTMAQQALASGSPGNNPRVPSAQEIERLYDLVWVE